MSENSSRPSNTASPAPTEATAPTAEAGKALEQLLGIMAKLRSPGGCPWDLAQDLDSLRPYLLEETHEVLEAMDAGDLGQLRAELGDLLFQIVFQARIAEERGAFAMTDVIAGIAKKLTRRHPHVFGEEGAPAGPAGGSGDSSAGTRPAPLAGPPASLSDLGRRWAELKRTERLEGGAVAPSALDGVPRQAPALLRAERTGEKAASEGFDWRDLSGVREKLREEIGELDAAIAGSEKGQIRAELGDVLFTLCNLARWLKTPAEDSLREAIARFERRFRYVEARLAERGKRVNEVEAAETERLWQEAKQLGPGD